MTSRRIASLRVHLEGAATAGADLQEIIDSAQARQAMDTREEESRERQELQETLNAKVIAASERFLVEGFAVLELEHSTIHKANATLQEVAADDCFSFEPEFARAGWTACWQQLARAMGRFREPLGEAPHQAVHQDTWCPP